MNDDDDEFLQRFDRANSIMRIVAGVGVIATVVAVIAYYVLR